MLELKKAHWKKLDSVITTDAVGTPHWMVFTAALIPEQQKTLTDPKLLQHFLGRKSYDVVPQELPAVKAMDLLPPDPVAWNATPICFDYRNRNTGKHEDLRMFQHADGRSVWFPRWQLEIFQYDDSHAVLYGCGPGAFGVRLNGMKDGIWLGLISSYPPDEGLDKWTVVKRAEAFNGVVEGVNPIDGAIDERDRGAGARITL